MEPSRYFFSDNSQNFYTSFNSSCIVDLEQNTGSDLILIEDDSDIEILENSSHSSTSKTVLSPAPVSPTPVTSESVAKVTTSTAEDASTESTGTLYDELRELPFPTPSITSQKREELLRVPLYNNRKRLVEVRGNKRLQLNKKTVQLCKDWVVIGDEGGICKACKLFIAPCDIPRVYGKFLSKPWTSYHRSQDLIDHAQNTYHVNSMTAMNNYLGVSSGKQLPVTAQVNKQEAHAMLQRKARLGSIIRALVHCARCGIALRGHRNEVAPFRDQPDDADDVIPGDVFRGNFMQVLGLRRQAGDRNIDIFINKRSKYTSPEIQNELLSRTAQQVLNQVIKDVEQSPCYSIIADETRDISNVEQLCVALRYYDSTTNCTEEKFVAFVVLESLKGA